METWAQRDESWVETGCAVLGGCSTLVLRAPCREVLLAFVWVFWDQIPISPHSFCLQVCLWTCRRVEGAANPSPQWDRLGALGVHRLRGEKGREVGWCWLLFLQPLLWTSSSENLGISSGSITPGLCCIPRLCTAGSRDIPSGGGENNPGSLCCFEAAAGAESGTCFHLTHPWLRWWHPWVTIKTRPCSWIGTSKSRCLLGVLGVCPCLENYFPVGWEGMKWINGVADVLG